MTDNKRYWDLLKKTDPKFTKRINKGFGEITTEIRMAPTFFYAEEYHQQYLAKNPGGYCGLRGTGISCAI